MKALRNSSPYLRAAICAFIFVLAFSVRSLTWHDTRFEVGKVQSSVAGDYQRVAELLRQEGIGGFFSSSSSLADLNNLGHPPGYSILIALVRAIFGSSHAAVQFMQILFDSFAAVLLFLIVLELFSPAPATIAGLFAALSPQLVWNSVLLLPDSLATFPILLGVFLLARSREKPRLATFVIIGALVGLSCWLRANAMLLTVFLAAAVWLLHGKRQMRTGCPRSQAWRYSLAVVAGTLLIVLPLTIRNAIATRHFIPVSLGAGQTLLEGIADYDTNRRFGIPNTDMGIMRQEAEIYQRPDYYGTLFKPDGVQRERARIKRGAGVIASNPVWFASVMVRRAASMTRLERSRLISTTPAVTNPIDTSNLEPISRPITTSSENLVREFTSQSPQAKSTFDSATGTHMLAADGSSYGKQFASESLPIKSNFDHLLKLALQIDQGRMKVSVIDSSGRAYASEILEPLEVKQLTEQPVQTIRLPFVTLDDAIHIELSNEASHQPPIVHVKSIKLFELGPARFAWTHVPRLILHGSQRVFITAVFLPLALIGVGLTIFRKRTAVLIILAVVPLYYFTVQSAFHTEYRYVLAVNYFLFAFAAVTIAWVGQLRRKSEPPAVAGG
ncbi:MAG: ArnT family glycosyltransferase [Acidobacteriota bacterium]